ncbi:hypothetical protein J7E79_15535 [Bacillus sp. ISL-40]|uniref:hypothetical protein n=1 Tax=unclassified Bacillus (in: firmicutes) TaxID=185979 RepID=UPI001BEC2262|nr:MULTISPECIES: hypothetical protein [unclassified Bacillus (in: firmicutes)]MBT2698813.1 hypothetical protein [Bacillus sp. ISL-40]MBT2720744.1 hypothetical protein [Bacillus sp. ISL-46]MBT2740979.1 hypothetical protein [Bacillus sp. ISL-77]
MNDSNFHVLTFHIKSRTMGIIKVKMTVRDLSALEKTFEAVKINLSLTNADGSTINLPILPKIKDDKGNVYCELDEEGERILKEYVGLQD